MCINNGYKLIKTKKLRILNFNGCFVNTEYKINANKMLISYPPLLYSKKNQYCLHLISMIRIINYMIFELYRYNFMAGTLLSFSLSILCITWVGRIFDLLSLDIYQ